MTTSWKYLSKILKSKTILGKHYNRKQFMKMSQNPSFCATIHGKKKRRRERRGWRNHFQLCLIKKVQGKTHIIFHIIIKGPLLMHPSSAKGCFVKSLNSEEDVVGVALRYGGCSVYCSMYYIKHERDRAYMNCIKARNA